MAGAARGVNAWVSLSVGEFLCARPEEILGRLTTAHARRFRGSEPAQLGAWEAQIILLGSALNGAPPHWHLLLEYDLLRLEKRIDAVLLTDRAILCLEFKVGAGRFDLAARRQCDDYAVDLHDFHGGSRAHPVVPVLVATAAPAPPDAPPLIWHGVVPPLLASGATLGELLRAVQSAVPPPAVALDPAAWLAAPYRPVPTVIEAATMLFARHGVEEIAAARADAHNLSRTSSVIRDAVDRARLEGGHLVLFVTGIPGAGKTLCGLNLVFGAARDGGAAFLTGNAPLVAVLREALARDAAAGVKGAIGPARHRSHAALQNVHKFLEHYVLSPVEVPSERVVVFDEAQRAWDADKATRDTQNRRSRLTNSEPWHMLEIMGRHRDWAVVVALVGTGQEINTGEAGLAEWGRVLAAGGGRWRALASPMTIGPGPGSRRLAAGPVPWLAAEPLLHLDVPVRAVRDGSAAPWVEAVLAGEAAAARAVADSAACLPFLLTRDLAAMRLALRRLARGNRRAGLVASAGNRRLRADGLGAELRGDPAILSWFLERWPDVRASDALEVPATEYSCQGLELDVVGLPWGGDLVRLDGRLVPRAFSGHRWHAVHDGEARDHVLNTYRVLLTRARYETVIWVPRGDPNDRTRPPGEADRLAEYLLECGARPLEAENIPDPAPALL